MSDDIVSALIVGAINLVGALVVVWVKHRLSERPASPSAATLTPTLLLAFIGFATGAASSGLRGQLASLGYQYGSLTAEIVLVLTCLALALGRARSRTSMFGYQLEVLALWAPFTVAWLIFHGAYVEPFVRQAVVLYLACAGVGGMLVLLFGRARSD